VNQYPNLLVVHTLSKSRSLAGLRVGYAVGHTDLIEGLVRVKDSFNSYPLGRIAQVGAQEAMEDSDWFETTCAKVIASRQKLVSGLEQLGFDVLPSAANFIFARHPGHEGAALTAALRERGIIVRHFRNPARVSPFMRITIGTDEQCAKLVAALQEILG
jgi:histidinol-phosphate aminotransferase